MHKKIGRFRTCRKPAIQAFAKYWGFWKRLYFTLGFWAGGKAESRINVTSTAAKEIFVHLLHLRLEFRCPADRGGGDRGWLAVCANAPVSCVCVLTHLLTKGPAGASPCSPRLLCGCHTGTWGHRLEGDHLSRGARTAELPGTGDLQHHVWGSHGQTRTVGALLLGLRDPGTHLEVQGAKSLATLQPRGTWELWAVLPSSRVLHTPLRGPQQH